MNISDIFSITFEYPFAFLAILPFIICEKFCKPKTNMIIFSNLKLLNKITSTNNILLLVLKWFAIIFLITALASPIKEDNLFDEEKKGRAIVLTIDTSGSMKEMGFDGSNQLLNKFKIVQDIVGEFINKRIEDNIGLVVFGEFAFSASPLTYDKKILTDILNRLYVGIAGERTAITDGLAQSVKMLKAINAKSKIIILLTDGRNTALKIPYKVSLEMAKNEHVKVYTIGIGREGEYDSALLEDIAKNTDGKFFKANNKEALQQIYETINNLEVSEIKSRQFVKKEYFFIYPLFISFVSLLLFVFIRNKKGL